MSWNHRVMAHQYDDEIFFEIHEVYYDKAVVPEMYSENGRPVVGESIEDLNWVLEKMKLCLEKPIIWAGDRFPEEYNNEIVSAVYDQVKQLEKNILKTRSAQLIQIGKSKGVIIPEDLIEKYNLENGFELIELKKAILIKPVFKIL